MPTSQVSQQHFSSSPDRKFTKRDLAVAEAFHNAWCRRKRAEGYYAPSENPVNADNFRDPAKSIHVNLIPFGELPLGERDKRLWLATEFKAITKEAEEIEAKALKEKK